MSSDIFLKAPDRHQALSEKYGIPDSFWSPICQKSNGFFGCEGHYDSDWKPDGHSRLPLPGSGGPSVKQNSGTWSRFLVKQVLPDAQSRVLSFAWFQIAFFLKQSASTGSILLCFDPPSSMQDRLEATLSSKDTKLNPCNPYTLHCVVTEEILAVFDNAIMSIRDQIRNLELVGMIHDGNLMEELTAQWRTVRTLRRQNPIILDCMIWHDTPSTHRRSCTWRPTPWKG